VLRATIAVSGLDVAALRLAVAASNLANASAILPDVFA